MSYILTDIEGTTTSISFVHDVLFPYARERMLTYLQTNEHAEHVQKAFEQIKETVIQEGLKVPANVSEYSVQLIEWIDADRKHPALKALQGYIWESGYRSGHVIAHVYPEVPSKLKEWKDQGHTLGVYSSGSVKAQHLLFEFTSFGNLLPLFSNHFDTKVGHKREIGSYARIAKELNLSPEKILFLSDIKEELDAARSAGMRTTQLVRQNDVVIGDHPTAKSFADINP